MPPQLRFSRSGRYPGIPCCSGWRWLGVIWPVPKTIGRDFIANRVADRLIQKHRKAGRIKAVEPWPTWQKTWESWDTEEPPAAKEKPDELTDRCQHLWREDGERFSRQKDGLYTMDRTIMAEPHRYTFGRLMDTGAFSVQPPPSARVSRVPPLDTGNPGCMSPEVMRALGFVEEWPLGNSKEPWWDSAVPELHESYRLCFTKLPTRQEFWEKVKAIYREDGRREVREMFKAALG